MSHLYCNQCGGTDIKKSKQNYHTITDGELHRAWIKFEGKIYPYPGGHVIKQDIGKRVVIVDGLAYMENQKQFEARLAKGE